MKLLLTIPHFFEQRPSALYGSQRKPEPRIYALSNAILALHQQFGTTQSSIHIAQRMTVPANTGQNLTFDLVITTTQGKHLLDRLPLPAGLYTHAATNAEPMRLGFACQQILRDGLGRYDLYGFLEDDLIIRDPMFFQKIAWFQQQAGDGCVLMPNRYEVAGKGPVFKAYVDGDLSPRVTAPFQDVDEAPTLTGQVMGQPVTFHRPLNPHAGCFFLNQAQMAHWARQSYFLDGDTSFIGPLESGATLGIMKTFKLYKPAPENAHFLEIEHAGRAFIHQIGSVVVHTPLR